MKKAEMHAKKSQKTQVKRIHNKVLSEESGGYLYYLLVISAASLCYYNVLDCGFVFDDMSAIRDNKDLRPATPLTNLLWNDFWGTPIHKEQSHKSYRPLCVLTYRLNYLLHELEPLGYHLTNVILHVLVCILYLRVSLMLVPPTTAFVAALLFAVHPIHTEAVTGVVGRAEILSSLFFLLAFKTYAGATNRWKTTDWFHVACSVVFVAMATLSKEQGITVVGICCAYEVFVVQRLKIPYLLHLLSSLLSPKSPQLPLWLRDMVTRLGVLIAAALCLLAARFRIMRAQLPVFTKFDNPAAAAEAPVRQLTFNYLFSVNTWLLLHPSELCCDWTMGTVPLIRSFLDPRNLATVGFYFFLTSFLWIGTWLDDARSTPVLMSTAFMAFPFLPASNLFFPVGFVVAERVLYTPSMGFCLLVGYGWTLLYEKTQCKFLLWSAVIYLVCVHAAKTIHRNKDWKNEYTIFMAGLKVNQRNAKLYNNVGHALESQGKHQEALEYFLEAVRVQPDDVGAHINVGRTYNNLHMFYDAEQAFIKAKNLLPRPRSGEPYQARIAPSHLNVFLNLANLISRNGTRLEEADALYKQAISMRSDYIQAYINRGDILVRLNRTQEAQGVYERALHFDDSNPDIYYNLGVVFLEQRKTNQALMYFDKALQLNPEHEQALLNSAVLIQESGGPHLRKIAYDRLNVLLRRESVNERVYFNLGMLAMDEKDFTLAEKWFRRAIDLRHDFRSALFNLALLLSEAQRPLEAVPFLKQLLHHHSDHVKGLILLGDIYINTIRDLDAAQKCYENILKQDPTNIQALHNLCVVHVERGMLEQAEVCLTRASKIAPQEDYITTHLQIVRTRLNAVRHLRQSKSAIDPSNKASRHPPQGEQGKVEGKVVSDSNTVPRTNDETAKSQSAHLVHSQEEGSTADTPSINENTSRQMR